MRAILLTTAVLAIAPIACAPSAPSAPAPLPSIGAAAVAAILDAGIANGVTSTSASAHLCTVPARVGIRDTTTLGLGTPRVTTVLFASDCNEPYPTPRSGEVILLIYFTEEPAGGTWEGQEYFGKVTELRGPNACTQAQPDHRWPYNLDCRKGYKAEWGVVVADRGDSFVIREVVPPPAL